MCLASFRWVAPAACPPARLLACLPACLPKCAHAVAVLLLPVCLSASACPLLQTLEYDSKVESICDDDDGLTHYRLVSLPACLPAPPRAWHSLPAAVRCGQAAGSPCGRAALAGLHAEAAPHLTTCPPARAPHPAAPDAPAREHALHIHPLRSLPRCTPTANLMALLHAADPPSRCLCSCCPCLPASEKVPTLITNNLPLTCLLNLPPCCPCSVQRLLGGREDLAADLRLLPAVAGLLGSRCRRQLVCPSRFASCSSPHPCASICHLSKLESPLLSVAHLLCSAHCNRCCPPLLCATVFKAGAQKN
jgi:hypothetical protein